MGSKQKKHKQSKHKSLSKKDFKQSGSKKNRQMSILGTDAGKLATALIGTAIAEVAQVAIAKALESANDDDNGDSKLGTLRAVVKDAATTIKESLGDATPSVKDTVRDTVATVKNLANDTQPTVANAVDAVTDKVKDVVDSPESVLPQKVLSTVDAVKEAIPLSTIAHVVNTVAHKTEAAQDTLNHTAANVADTVGRDLPRPDFADVTHGGNETMPDDIPHTLADMKATALDVVRKGKDRKKKKKHKKGKKA